MTLVQNQKYKKNVFDLDGLSKLIETEYLKKRRPNGFVQKKSFSPSSVAYGHGTCPRYWNIAFAGAEAEDVTDAISLATMAVGTASHERIQQVFEDAGILVSKEVKISLNDPPIFGFVDLLINFDDKKIVGEIKTTRQEAFLHRQVTNKPAAYHLYQLLIYMHVMNKQYGFILYENKNDGAIVVIPVEMNEVNRKIVNDALDWMREVYAARDENIKRPFRKNNKICKACPFSRVCAEKENGEKVIKPLTVVKQ